MPPPPPIPGPSARRPAGAASRSARYRAHGLALLLALLGSWVSAAAEVRFRSWTTRDGLPHEQIDAIAQTPSGHLWLATPSGLVRFDGRDFLLLQVFGPGAQNAPQSLLTDAAGRLWVVSRSGGIRYQQDGRLHTAPRAGDAPEFQARGLYTDSGGLFLATDATGRIWRWLDDALHPWLDTRSAVSAELPFVGINVDRSGRVWARHRDVLSWWSGTQWNRLGNPPGLATFSATKTGASQDGGMWIADRHAVRKFSKDGWLPVEFQFPHEVGAIQCLTEDRQGRLWLSTGNDGLWSYDRTGTLSWYQTAEGLASPAVRQVFEDADGNLWIATAQGLSMLPNAQPVPDPAGVGVDRVVVDDVPLQPEAMFAQDAVRIPRGARAVGIHFSVVHFDPRAAVRLRYRLDGVDADWKLAGGDRTATYTHLPAGRHVLRIAASPAGNWERTREATLRFEVEPQPWQSWPLRTAAASVLLLSVVAGYHLRLTRLRRSRERHLQFSRQLIESQEAERQRIAAELHDSLGQQLLVIKNCARLGLREPATVETLRQQLQRVSETTSECLEEVRTMARVLRPYQLDQMGLTKAIRALVEQLRQPDGPLLTTDLDDLDRWLPPEWEIHVYRIVQESLHNALRHARASEVKVHIDHIGPSLNLRIEDNGRGLPAPSRPESSPGFGLTSIRERARLMGGVFHISARPGGGTTLSVVVPLPGPVPELPEATHAEDAPGLLPPPGPAGSNPNPNPDSVPRHGPPAPGSATSPSPLP